MKKSYETPSIEVVKFQYRDQVVATSGTGSVACIFVRVDGFDKCGETPSHWESNKGPTE